MNISGVPFRVYEVPIGQKVWSFLVVDMIEDWAAFVVYRVREGGRGSRRPRLRCCRWCFRSAVLAAVTGMRDLVAIDGIAPVFVLI